MDRRNRPVIFYYLEEKSKLSNYVMDFLSDFTGIMLKESNDLEKANIYYGNKKTNHKIRINRNPKDIQWTALIEQKAEINEFTSFDIINALGFFLCDLGNASKTGSDLDEHKRLKHKKSYQFIHKISDFPIVNIYAKYFAELITKHLGLQPLPLYPNQKKACIILSHDVDNPGKFDDLYNLKILPNKLSFNQFLKHYRFLLGTLKNLIIDKERNENWNFDQILAAEKKYGFTSTFFFATVFRQSKIGHQLDVPYNLKKKKYKKVLKKIVTSNHSIGLHSSYKAYSNIKNFRIEKERLEQYSGIKTNGLRHHYWHLGEDINATLLLHEKLGFAYDSSLAFNDAIGFRYNTALPFYPYILKEERAISVLQIPVFCMDGNLFYNKSMTTSIAIEMILKYINIIVKHNGVGSIDWHVSTSFPGGKTFKKWGETYLNVLAHLNEMEDIWVTDADSFNQWWTKDRYHNKLENSTIKQ